MRVRLADDGGRNQELGHWPVRAGFEAIATTEMAQNSKETAKKRGPGRPFPKGKSGNPGGRPKTRTAAAAAREWLADTYRRAPDISNAEALISTLGEQALGGDVQAARLLIAYAEGLPQAKLDVTHSDEQKRQEWAERQLEKVMETLNLERGDAIEWMKENTPSAAQWIN
jgi:hypothetical protein